MIIIIYNFFKKIHLIGIIFGLQYGFLNIILNFFFFKKLYNNKNNINKYKYILLYNIINIYLYYFFLFFFIFQSQHLINILIISYLLILLINENINIYFIQFLQLLKFFIFPVLILNKLIYIYIYIKYINLFSIIFGYFLINLFNLFIFININKLNYKLNYKLINKFINIININKLNYKLNYKLINKFINIININKLNYKLINKFINIINILLFIIYIYFFGKISIPIFINNYKYYNNNYIYNYNIYNIKNYFIKFLFYNINKYNQYIKYFKNNNFEKIIIFEISQYFFNFNIFNIKNKKQKKYFNFFFTFPPSLYIFYNLLLNNKYSIINYKKNYFNFYKIKLKINKYIYIYLKKRYIYIFKKRFYNLKKKLYIKNLYDPLLNKFYRKIININKINKYFIKNKLNNKLIINININNISYIYIYEILKKLPKYSYKLINELEQQENEENLLIDDYDIRSRKYKDILIFSNKKLKYYNYNDLYLINYYNQSDFDHDIIKGYIRTYRRKILIFKKFQFKTYSNIFFYKFKKKYYKIIDINIIKLDFQNSIIITNIIKSLMLIIQSIFRKYIKIPLIIIIKNIFFFYYYKKKSNEQFNDFLKQKKETHIVCTLKKIPLFNLNNNNKYKEFSKNYIFYITEGIKIKVLHPYNYNNNNNNNKNYFFFKIFGIKKLKKLKIYNFFNLINNKNKKYNKILIFSILFKYKKKNFIKFIINNIILKFINLFNLNNNIKNIKIKNKNIIIQIYLILLKLKKNIKYIKYYKNKYYILLLNYILLLKYKKNKILIKNNNNNIIINVNKLNKKLNKLINFNIYQFKYNNKFNIKIINNIKYYNNYNYNNINNNNIKIKNIKKNEINLEILLKKKNFSELIKKGILLIDSICIFNNNCNKNFYINIIIKNYIKIKNKNIFYFLLPENIFYLKDLKKIKIYLFLNIFILKLNINNNTNTKKYEQIIIKNKKKYKNYYKYNKYIQSNFTFEDLININKIYINNNLLKIK